MCWACGQNKDAYAIPVGGYVTLWPYRRLDTDFVRALAKAEGAPVGDARWWAVVTDDGTRHRLPVSSVQQARERALKLLDGEPGVLARVTARSAQGDIYELTEALVHLDIVVAAGHPTAELIGLNGIAIAKEGSPFSAVDLRLLTKRLASQLVSVERKRMQPVIQRYLQRLDGVDWTSGPAVDRALRNARDFLRRTAPGAVLPSWSQRVRISVQDVATKTKIALNETYLPSLSTSLAQPDITSVNRIATQNGWFLRDEWGRRSDALTTRGRAIVQQGLVRGLGKNEIGAQLMRELPGLARQYGRRYAATAASVAVSRARSYTEVSSYASVGIEYLEVQAVLDERTTEQCRALDGTIIEVKAAQDQIERAANVANPEDIYSQSPFMRVRRDPQSGDRDIVTNNGARIARVVQSGVGRRDDRGRHAFYRAGNRLNEANIGPPPYHHLCRSWTIPRSDVVQVPRNYAARSVAPAILAFDERLGRSVPTGRDSMTRQPVEQFRAPRASGPPVVAGSHLPIDDYQLPVFRKDLPMAQRMRRADGDAMAFRASPHDYERQTFRPDRWKFTTPGTAPDLDGMFGPPGSDAVAELFVKGNRERAIASALANPSAVGRDSLWRIADMQGRNVEWVRARLLNVPGYRRAADNYRRAIAEGQSLRDITVAAEALVTEGRVRGWLGRSARLDAVTEAQAARVRAVSRGTPTTAKPGRRPPPQPKQRQPDTISHPAPTTAARRTVPADAPLFEQPVQAGVYAARPDPQAMVSAVVDSETLALASGLKVEAGSGALAAQKPWARITKAGIRGSGSRNFFDAADVALDASDKVASVFMARETLSINDWHAATFNIIDAEAARGYKGIRDWIVTDARGVTRFVRVDGAKLTAAREQGTGYFDNRLNAAIYDNNAEAIRDLGLTFTDSLRTFYPRASIDWNSRNLIPGVPIAEQVERRIAAVRAEMAERLEVRAASKGATLNRQEVGAELRAAVRETAGKGGIASKMRRSSVQQRAEQEGETFRRRTAAETLTRNKDGLDVTDRTILNTSDEIADFVDQALTYASDGLRAAVQTVPMPDVITTGWSTSRAWCEPRVSVLRSSETAIIKMPGTIAEVKKLPPSSRIPQLTPGSKAHSGAIERMRWERTFAHEMQHHVDGIALNDLAMREARSRAILDGRVRNIYGHTEREQIEVGLPGRYVDPYDGKLYGEDRTRFLNDAAKGRTRTAESSKRVLQTEADRRFEAGASSGEYSTMGRQRLNSDRETVRMWEQDPDQFAFTASMLRGHYTPY